MVGLLVFYKSYFREKTVRRNGPFGVNVIKNPTRYT